MSLGLLAVLAAGCGGPQSATIGRPVTLEGEVVDPQCYFTHGGRGPAHRACALLCARGGQDLAFLNRAGGRVYPIIAARHGENPNDSLYAVVGYPVVVVGALYEKGGQKVLRVDGVKRLDRGS
ncbi:MAG: hypothetical protein E6K78_08865 [Candidatus Eisenbacteria bacterium]|uniref:Uncharacterized protein n=1 Tax=Eiseniibacteriota bacterium TaxID=2212470 RepID=A0A538TLX9_UNCEI|nr:MAG: hypothetical protein E6K78_08865 [Candidatus Eisenbacteria bacterium]